MLSIAIETITPETQCCECGYKTNRASGPVAPSPGDFSLCMKCASLNVFDANMTMRSPTLDEFLLAAKDSELQLLRKIILDANEKIAKLMGDTDAGNNQT